VLSRGACLPTPSSTIAAHELALFLCQGGGGRGHGSRADDNSMAAEPACSVRPQAEADRLLASLGFRFRLAPQARLAPSLSFVSAAIGLESDVSVGTVVGIFSCMYRTRCNVPVASLSLSLSLS
jgi:hypothetical protein